MFQGIKALLGSEKALIGGSLMVCATVLAALGHMTVDQWTSYTEVVFLGYVGGKTVQGAVASFAGSKSPTEAPAADPAPAVAEPVPAASASGSADASA